MSASISTFYYLSLHKQCGPQHSSFGKPQLYNAARGLNCMHVFGINLSLFGFHFVPKPCDMPGSGQTPRLCHQRNGTGVAVTFRSLCRSGFVSLCNI